MKLQPTKNYIKSYKPIATNHLADHDYCINTKKEHFNIICKYADDISKASTDRNEITLKTSITGYTKKKRSHLTQPKPRNTPLQTKMTIGKALKY